MLQGTRVLTSRGTEPVENLSIGDNVVTSRGEAKPIKWIGRRRFTQGPSSRWPDNVHPIRVARSALADNVPHADLYLSPMHALFIDGVLIPVKDLVNGTSISRSVPEGIQDIEYFHIELETHEVILAEGAPVETLLVTDGRENFTNFVEYERLYGRETGRRWFPVRPYLVIRMAARTSRRCCALPFRRWSTYAIPFRWPTIASPHVRPIPASLLPEGGSGKQRAARITLIGVLFQRKHSPLWRAEQSG